MRWVGLLAIGLLLVGCHPRPKITDAVPKSVLGIPYTQARRALLSQGYKAAQFGPSDAFRRRSEICDDLAGLRCRTYLETWDCKSPGDCEFDFVRAADHRVLLVTTQGDLPPSVWDLRWANADDVAARKISNH
jgi:hypothetical protein